MADKLIEQEVVVSVNQALKAIDELQKQVGDLTEKLNENEKSQGKNTNEQKKSKEQMKKQAKEAKQLTNALKGIKHGADSVASSLRKITGISFGKLVNNASKLGKGLYEMLGQSINASEQLNMFNVVFGNMEKDGEKVFSDLGLKATRFQNQLNELFSTNKVETLQMQALFQSLATNTGVQADVAEKMSERMVYLTYDLASLYNKSEGEVAKAIQSGVYAGQTRPMRQVGVDLTQNNLGVTLQELGINDKAVSDLSQAEKQVLRYITAVRSASVANNDFAHTINSPANQLKILKQQFIELSVAIGNLFMRAFANILPYVNAIIMVIKEVLKTIATLFGIETEDYNTAQGSIDGLSDGYDDVGESANNATKAVKELKRQTLSFDQINNLTSPSKQGSSGGGGSGGGGAIGAIDQRLIDALDKYDLKLDNVHNKAREIRDRIMEWLGFIKLVDEQTGEVSFKFGLIYRNSQDLAEIYGIKLAQGLNELVNKVDFEGIGKKIADGLNTVTTFTNNFFDIFDFHFLGSRIADGLNTAIKEIDAKELGKSLTNLVRSAFEFALGFVETFEWEGLGENLADALVSGIQNINFANVVKTAQGTIGGLLDTIKGFFFEIDWDDIFSEMYKTLNALDLGTLGEKLSDALTTLYRSMSEAISTFNWSGAVKKVIDQLVEFIRGIDWGELIISIIRGNVEMAFAKFEMKLGFIEGIFEGAVNIIKDVFEGLPDFFGSIVDEIVDFFDELPDKIGPILLRIFDFVGKVFMELPEVIGTVISGIVEFFLSIPGKIMELFMALVDFLGAIFDNLVDIIKGDTDIDELWDEYFGDFEEEADKAEKKVDEFAESLKKLRDQSKENYDISGGQVIRYQELADELGGLIDANGKVKESEKTRAKVIIEQLNEALGTEMSLGDDLIIKNGKQKTSYENIKKEIEKLIKIKKLNALMDAYLDEYKERLKQLAQDQAKYNELVKKYGDNATDAQKKEIEELKNHITENSNFIKSFDNMSYIVQTGFDEMDYEQMKMVKDWEKNSGTALEGIAYSAEANEKYITETQNKAWGAINTHYRNLIDKGKTFYAEHKDQIDAYYQKIKGNLNGLNGTKVNVTTDLKTTKNYSNVMVEVNGLNDKKICPKVDIQETSKTKSFFDKFKGLRDTISNFLGGKAEGGIFIHGSWKPVQQYASGGLPSTGQLFMAREAGPELVGKIGNATAVMNNNQIVSSVASGVAQAVKGVMTGNSGGIEVYVHTDEGVVVDRINRITKRTGECPIQI